MTMNQIKKRIGKDNTFTLAQFRLDMLQVWENARLYNQEGSWVYIAADEMQSFFEQKWAEEMSNGGSAGDAGQGVKLEGSNGASTVASGTSTPMYKPEKAAAVLPTRIKFNVSSAKSRLAEVSRDPTPSEEESEEDDEDDDDY